MKPLLVLILVVFLNACATVDDRRGPRVLVQALCGHEITVIVVSRDGRVLMEPADVVHASPKMLDFLKEVALEMKADGRIILMDHVDQRLRMTCRLHKDKDA